MLAPKRNLNFRAVPQYAPRCLLAPGPPIDQHHPPPRLCGGRVHTVLGARFHRILGITLRSKPSRGTGPSILMGCARSRVELSGQK